MVELGMYEHYKGGQYKVIANGLNESDEVPVVIYEALYDNDRSKVWVRPEHSFNEIITYNGQEVPRFKKI